MNKKGDAYIIIATIGAIFLLFIIIIGILSITGLHIIITDNGRHTGYVTAIETNGWIFKTHSVYFKTDTAQSQEDRYCVIDENLKNELLNYQENGTKVTLKFIDYMSRGISYCKSLDNGIIVGIEK